MPFKSGRTSVLESFPFADIAAGTSFVNYYGAKASGAYVLMSNKGYSDETHTTSIGDGTDVGTHTPTEDLDFDIRFEHPRVIEGKTVINAPIVIGANGANLNEGKLHFLVRKWDGTNETELASDLSVEVSYTGETGGLNQHFVMLSGIVDIPRTKFKPGESLRLTIRAYCNSGNGGQSGIGHSPKGRDFILPSGTTASTLGPVTTPSEVQFPVPFKLTA